MHVFVLTVLFAAFAQADVEWKTVNAGGDTCGDYHGDVQVLNVDLVGTEKRQTEKSYKGTHALNEKQFQERFSAAGRIICPWAQASATVACDKNTIVTSEHIFVDEKSGKVLGMPSQCQIQMRINGVPTNFPMTDNFAAGVPFQSPGNMSKQAADAQQTELFKDMDSKTQRDWMVIHLDNALPDYVKPWHVQKVNPLAQPGQTPNITTFSAIQDGWMGTNTPSYSDCTILGGTTSSQWNTPDRLSTVRGIQTDCDVTEGSSGSGVAKIIDGVPVLVAITRGGPDPAGKRAEFDRKSHFSLHLAVENNLQDAIANYCHNIEDPGTVSLRDSQSLLVSKY